MSDNTASTSILTDRQKKFLGFVACFGGGLLLACLIAFVVKEVLPTSNLTTRMIVMDMIQLVIIELVTGKGPIEKACSAVRRL